MGEQFTREEALATLDKETDRTLSALRGLLHLINIEDESDEGDRHRVTVLLEIIFEGLEVAQLNWGMFKGEGGAQ